MAVNGSTGKDEVAGGQIPDDDDLDDTDRRTTKPAIPGAKGGGGRLPFVLIGVAVLAVVAVIAVFLTTRSSGKKVAANTTTTLPSCPKRPVANTPLPAVSGPYTDFQDPVAKFSLSYPAAWTATKASDPNVPLLVHLRSDDLDTLLVRVLPIHSSIDTSNEANIKSFTDAVISGTSVQVLKQQPIKVNGLLGYYYLYLLPPDPCFPNTTIVHSHFFLFPPREMIALVFQTAEPDFAPLAAAFDQVVASVRATA